MKRRSFLAALAGLPFAGKALAALAPAVKPSTTTHLQSMGNLPGIWLRGLHVEPIPQPLAGRGISGDEPLILDEELLLGRVAMVYVKRGDETIVQLAVHTMGGGVTWQPFAPIDGHLLDIVHDAALRVRCDWLRAADQWAPGQVAKLKHVEAQTEFNRILSKAQRT